jgi:hypothetical protein
MILIPPNRALYTVDDTIDFRRSFDALVAITRERLGLDALRSAVVLFFHRDRTRCKHFSSALLRAGERGGGRETASG